MPVIIFLKLINLLSTQSQERIIISEHKQSFDFRYNYLIHQIKLFEI